MRMQRSNRSRSYYLGYIYAAMSAAELDHSDEAHDLMRQARGVQPDLSFAQAHTALGWDGDQCRPADVGGPAQGRARVRFP